MAIEVTVGSDAVEVELSGWDRIFALKSRLAVPRDRITAVSVVHRSEVGWPPALRAPGTFVPGAIKHGSYGMGAKREFWALFRQERVLVMEVDQWGYARVVLGLQDADLVAITIGS